MLRACRKLLRSSGSLGFFTIFPTPGLGERDYRRACALGPRAAATRRRTHEEMLERAGFGSLEVVDLTDDFRRVSGILLSKEIELEDAIRPAVGDDLYFGRLLQLEESLRAVDEGLLRRALFLAR